jgi:hypothetical protein
VCRRRWRNWDSTLARAEPPASRSRLLRLGCHRARHARADLRYWRTHAWYRPLCNRRRHAASSASTANPFWYRPGPTKRRARGRRTQNDVVSRYTRLRCNACLRCDMDVFNLLQRRALVSRGAAQTILAAIESEPPVSDTTLDLDFSGVDAVAPSFVDELISGLWGSNALAFSQIRIIRPPSRLSEKFLAIGRSRGLAMEEGEDGEWIITLSAESARE